MLNFHCFVVIGVDYDINYEEKKEAMRSNKYLVAVDYFGSCKK